MSYQFAMGIDVSRLPGGISEPVTGRVQTGRLKIPPPRRVVLENGDTEITFSKEWTLDLIRKTKQCPKPGRLRKKGDLWVCTVPSKERQEAWKKKRCTGVVIARKNGKESIYDRADYCRALDAGMSPEKALEYAVKRGKEKGLDKAVEEQIEEYHERRKEKAELDAIQDQQQQQQAQQRNIWLYVGLAVGGLSLIMIAQKKKGKKS